MNLNMQPIEKLDRQEDGSLDIVQVWYTIQGEGPFVGCPAVFVRLAGCVLDCKFCDADYTSNRRRVSWGNLLDEIDKVNSPNGRGSDLIVLTGGEPYRQNIRPFIMHAHDDGYTVQIETNGTLYQNLPSDVVIVCSPKTPLIHAGLRPHITSLKYVVQDGYVSEEDGLPTITLGRTSPVARPGPQFSPDQIFVQPLDECDEERNKRNLAAAVASCLRWGYRLSIQSHKIAGLE